MVKIEVVYRISVVRFGSPVTVEEETVPLVTVVLAKGGRTVELEDATDVVLAPVGVVCVEVGRSVDVALMT